jgi:20S proteasome subunit beta 7
MEFRKIFDDSFWKNGPKPGCLYNFPATSEHTQHDPIKHTLSPMVTGTSVLGLKFDDGIIIAADTLGSYGSLARYRTVSRLMKVNDTTVMGAGGDYADFQFIKSIIEQRVIEDECLADGFSYTPKSLYNWLTRVMYNRRSKFNPLWNTIVVGGVQDGQPFLGYVDKIGTAYEAPSVASGYGAYIAQPLLRGALEQKPVMTEAEAKTVIEYCMKVLYYRDARAWNKYEIAVVRKDKQAEISNPIELKGEWSIAHSVRGYE